jgi:hypothetical protein
MTKDEMFTKILDVVQENTRAFGGIKEILKENNDRSALHLQDTKNVLMEIKSINKNINRFYKIFSVVFIAIVLALIVLAGGKEVLPIISKLL